MLRFIWDDFVQDALKSNRSLGFKNTLIIFIKWASIVAGNIIQRFVWLAARFALIPQMNAHLGWSSPFLEQVV